MYLAFHNAGGLVPPGRARSRARSQNIPGALPRRVIAHPGGRGLAGGSGDPVKDVIVSAPSIAGGILTYGGSESIAAAWGALAVPIVGAVVAGVTIALTLLLNRKGPKQKEATTAIVNKMEPLLQDNLKGYLAGPRTKAAQLQALNNFDGAWQWVVDNCNVPQMGNPGKACVEDRQSGACHWRDSAGACFNWFAGYRDPIANDTSVVPDSVLGPSLDSIGLNSSILNQDIAGFPLSAWLLGAGLVLVVAGDN